MSLNLETLNRGFVENFGYSYGGVQRVLLGELPAMPTPQFCELATQVLLEISGRLDEPSWRMIGESLQLAFLRDEQTKVDRESIFDLPELLPVTKVSDQDLSGEGLGMTLQGVEMTEELAQRIHDADETERRRLMESLIANLILKNGWVAEAYQANPFSLTEDRVLIGTLYELSYLEFAGFVSQILAGGIFGWDENQGMPKAAKEAIAKLKEIWA